MQVIRQLYHERSDEIYRFFLVRTGDVARAEELVQETFSQACASLWRYRGDASLRTWLYAIARNVLRQSRRRRQRRPIPVEPEVVESMRALSRAQLLHFPTPEEQVLKDIAWEQLLAALAELPEHYQTVLWLRDGEELPYVELAAIMERSAGATRVLVYRARRALRRSYEDLSQEPASRTGSDPR